MLKGGGSSYGPVQLTLSIPELCKVVKPMMDSGKLVVNVLTKRPDILDSIDLTGESRLNSVDNRLSQFFVGSDDLLVGGRNTLERLRLFLRGSKDGLNGLVHCLSHCGPHGSCHIDGKLSGRCDVQNAGGNRNEVT